MIRIALLAAALAAVAGCTLLLPTNELIVNCDSQAVCDELGPGFVCEDNACLPEDDDAATSG